MALLLAQNILGERSGGKAPFPKILRAQPTFNDEGHC